MRSCVWIAILRQSEVSVSKTAVRSSSRVHIDRDSKAHVKATTAAKMPKIVVHEAGICWALFSTSADVVGASEETAGAAYR